MSILPHIVQPTVLQFFPLNAKELGTLNLESLSTYVRVTLCWMAPKLSQWILYFLALLWAASPFRCSMRCQLKFPLQESHSVTSSIWLTDPLPINNTEDKHFGLVYLVKAVSFARSLIKWVQKWPLMLPICAFSTFLTNKSQCWKISQSQNLLRLRLLPFFSSELKTPSNTCETVKLFEFCLMLVFCQLIQKRANFSEIYSNLLIQKLSNSKNIEIESNYI